MNLPLQVPSTLTSYPFSAMVPFSFPQNVSQFFKVIPTLGFLLPTLPFSTPFSRAPTLLSPPTPLIWKSQAKNSYYEFKFQHSNFLVGRVSTFVIFSVYFFFVPSLWQKKKIINFLSSLKIHHLSLFIIMFFNLINLMIMDWIFDTW